MPIRLFISHSERDGDLAGDLNDWLQSGLNLTEEDIRCTSVIKLNTGGTAEVQLRDDLQSSTAVVGLLTTNSLRSHWAQLEMGAGWLQERLHLIRGPGIHASDLPAPLSNFVTVGYCETDAMNNLLDQLAGLLDTEVNSEVEQEIETIAQAAQETLVANMVRWFSLPPVLSAWRIKKTQYEFELLSLESNLDLERSELLSCTTPMGFLTRDPDRLPMWAKDLWDVSKNVVNFMLSRPSRVSGDFFDIPRDVLPDRLLADMKRGLESTDKRARLMREWFENAENWILENPPSERTTHSPSNHP